MNKIFKENQVVLFQGDSITDCQRDRNDENSLGNGYVNLIAKKYAEIYPETNVRFINKGVSGDRVHNLIERYVEDFMDISPDFISIMVGINDVWRRYDSNDPSTVDAYKDHYEYLLKMIKTHMPETKILLIEPFLIHSKPEIVIWHEDLDPKIQAVRELAQNYADYYLPLDGIFASLCVKKYKKEEIAEDGVHPTLLGHKIIADEIMKLLEIIDNVT